MSLKSLTAGANAPREFDVVIEIPGGSDSIKYEFDAEAGVIRVDRFMHTSMHYPAAYGFIPSTLGGDGDPVDVLVITSDPVIPGCVLTARAVGVLLTEDEKGRDEKILAVPISKLDPSFDKIKEYSDLPEILTRKISHFFENYKDLESNKWVKVLGWEGADPAMKIIAEAIKRYHKE